MKSSDMRCILRKAEENEIVLSASTLAFYAAQGSFVVREQLADLIVRRSRIVGELSADFRLDFLLKHLRDSFGSVPRDAFFFRAGAFLSEIHNYDLSPQQRQKRLQQYICLLESLRGDSPDESRLATILFTDELVRLFPEVANTRKYAYSPDFAYWITESVKVYAPPPRIT